MDDDDPPTVTPARCPICGSKLQPVLYGMPVFPVPDGVLVGGGLVGEEAPTHGGPSCYRP